MATTHIIGAGLAGLAAATTLARAGHHVQCYESAATAGGRISQLFDAGDNIGYEGTHALLFDTYTTLKQFAQRIGSEHTFIAHTMAGNIYDAKQKTYATRRAFLLPPASSLVDYIAWFRFFLSRNSQTVEQEFDYFHPLSEQYIEPLCKALTFQNVHQSETRMLASKLRYLLRKGRKGMRLLLPRHSLYQSLIAPAIAQIEQESGTLYYQHRLQQIEWQNGRVCTLHFNKQRKTIGVRDHVILALPYASLQGLNLPIALPPFLNANIVNVVYKLTDAPEENMPPRVIPIIGGTVDWLKREHGRVIATCYDPYRLMSLDNDAIARKIWSEIAPILKMPHAPMPEVRVLRERKAITHAILKTPPSMSNLYLAGDYCAAAHLPPIEAAISSGQLVAESIIATAI